MFAAPFQSACPSLYVYASNCFSTYASLKENKNLEVISSQNSAFPADK